MVQDLAVNEDGDANAAVEQDEWAPWMAEGNNDNLDQLMEEVTVVHVDHQESFSLDQSGSTASYMRASGADYVLNVQDFSSSSSEATFVLPVQPSQIFQEVEVRAFRFLVEPSSLILANAFLSNRFMQQVQPKPLILAEPNPLAIVPFSANFECCALKNLGI